MACKLQGACAEHRWVLCVDDDVLLYETFLEDLIRSMQQRPSFFMATGPIPDLLSQSCLYHSLINHNIAYFMVSTALRSLVHGEIALSL